MKVTITFPTYDQTSPDNFVNYTKVIHVDPNKTIKEIYDEYFENWKTVNVELHIEENNE